MKNYSKKLLSLIIIANISLFNSCQSDDNSKKAEASSEQTIAAEEWELTFEDNFDGAQFDAPDSTKWESLNYNRKNNANGPDGWWSSEDVYLNGDGNLAIRVRQTNNLNNDNDSYDFSTGMIRSKGKFEQKFGRFEIRCQLPQKSGWWVAFWLFNSSVNNVDGSGEDGTEIDIMEAFGWTDKINHALHYDGYAEAHQSLGIKTEVPGIRQGFHIYALEWTAEEYVFLLMILKFGEQILEVFQKFHLILKFQEKFQQKIILQVFIGQIQYTQKNSPIIF